MKQIGFLHIHCYRKWFWNNWWTYTLQWRLSSSLHSYWWANVWGSISTVDLTLLGRFHFQKPRIWNIIQQVLSVKNFPTVVIFYFWFLH